MGLKQSKQNDIIQFESTPQETESITTDSLTVLKDDHCIQDQGKRRKVFLFFNAFSPLSDDINYVRKVFTFDESLVDLTLNTQFCDYQMDTCLEWMKELNLYSNKIRSLTWNHSVQSYAGLRCIWIFIQSLISASKIELEFRIYLRLLRGQPSELQTNILNINKSINSLRKLSIIKWDQFESLPLIQNQIGLYKKVMQYSNSGLSELQEYFKLNKEAVIEVDIDIIQPRNFQNYRMNQFILQIANELCTLPKLIKYQLTNSEDLIVLSELTQARQSQLLSLLAYERNVMNYLPLNPFNVASELFF